MSDNCESTDGPENRHMDSGNCEITASSQKSCNFNWVNVTEEFFQATNELEGGELLKDDMFGLFEAMSAIEMMDPKMDAGMMCNRGSKKVLNFDQAVKLGKLKIKDLEPSEQVGIIDATLACLVTWLEGHSLAQTVFTNLYLQKPHLVEDKIIKAFSIHTLKLLSEIREFINKAGVYEEEDFQPVMYGYKLATEVPISKSVQMMKEVEDELNKRAKASRPRPDVTYTAEMQRDHENSTALAVRIRFCRQLSVALHVFQKKKSFAVEEADKYLLQCEQCVAIMQKSIGLGIQPDASEETTNRADYPTIMGFEPLVNQRLLPPTFPRYTKIKSRKDAFEYLELLVTRMRKICSITEHTTFHSALEFLGEFSKSSPCVLSRSALQLLYMTQTQCSEPGKVLGTMHIVDVLRDAIKAFIKPPALMSKCPLMQIPQAKEYVDTFLNHCVGPFCTLVRIMGHNRARQRDKMSHILEDLVALQEEADKVDSYLHNLAAKLETPFSHVACFGTWVLYHTLRAMIHYILLGFELELYSSHEYTYIFWYLYEFLYGWLVSSLNRANNTLHEIDSKADKKNRNKKSKSKKRSTHHKREITFNQALQNLCGGYYKAVCGFRLAGKLKSPYQEFDDERVRYEHRFAPFNIVITPPPVSYVQFREMMDGPSLQGVTPEDYYLESCKNFNHAKIGLDTIGEPTEEILNLLKVSKANFVVMKVFLSGHKKNSKEPIEFDFSVHKNFPIIKLS